MSVDKAFEEHENKITWNYGDYYDRTYSRRDFKAGYEAGQKTLSPEVFEKLKDLAMGVDHCVDVHGNTEFIQAVALSDIEKLLEAGE